MNLRIAVLGIGVVFVISVLVSLPRTASTVPRARNSEGRISTTSAPAAVLNESPGSSPYMLDGCHVYTANDWFTTNLQMGGSSYASNTVDPNSAAIISNFNTALSSPVFNINGSTASISGHAVINQASNSTPLLPVGGTTMVNAHEGNVIPWLSRFFNGNDEHTVVLNTQTCVDYELYSPAYSGSSISADNGYVHDLNHPFNDQFHRDGGLMTKSGIPLLGTLNVGEDAFASSINHIAYMLIPGSDGSSNAAGGYVAPATAGATCVSNCTNKLPFGARMRLNSSKYTCPDAASNPQAHKICVQLETYGAIIMDHNGVSTYGIQLAPSGNGANPWNETDVSALNGIPLTDWDVMALGTVH